jgi:hypothetical protein
MERSEDFSIEYYLSVLLSISVDANFAIFITGLNYNEVLANPPSLSLPYAFIEEGEFVAVFLMVLGGFQFLSLLAPF